MGIFSPGQLIGGNRYSIERLLGSGGFADVYLAQHLGLKRTCALKVLVKQTGRFTYEELKAFSTEAERASQLKHPHIITVIDFFTEYVAGSDIPIMVMD